MEIFKFMKMKNNNYLFNEIFINLFFEYKRNSFINLNYYLIL